MGSWKGIRQVRQRRWRYTAAVVLAIAGVISFMLPGRSGANVIGSPSNFESNDGNMTIDSANAADWNCFSNGNGGLGGNGFRNVDVTGDKGSCSAKLVPANATAIHLDGFNGGNGEVTWKSGQKMDSSCPSLSDNGSVPNKDDFTDIATYFEVDTSTVPASGYLYGGEIRSTSNGNSSGNVELNQNAGPVGNCTSQIARTPGDILLAFDFTAGGTMLNFHALTWIDGAHQTLGGNNGTCFISHDSVTSGCWGAAVVTNGTTVNGKTITVGGCQPAAADDVDGCSNQNPITNTSGDENAISNQPLTAQQFAEFGVNLTKLVTGLQTCQVSFAQMDFESRSSGSSFTSNPEDIEIQPAPEAISTCGTITIVKHTAPRGVSHLFSFSSPGLTPTSFQLNDSGCTSSATCNGNNKSFLGVPPGEYTITETEATGFTFDNITCTNNNQPYTPKSASNGAVTIDLQSGDGVTCTFLNDQDGTINIFKSTDPGSIGTDFTYSSNLPSGVVASPKGSTSSFTLNAGSGAGNPSNNPDEETFTDVPPGNTSPYTVTEGAEPSGWGFEGLSCSPSSSSGAGSSFGVQNGTTPTEADITVGPGGTVNCTFTNYAESKVSVESSSDVPGVTNSTIVCKDSSQNNVGTPVTTPVNDAKFSVDGLKVGTYNCQVVIAAP